MQLFQNVRPAKVKSLFTETKSPVDYQSKPNTTNDFKRQPLLVNPLSFSGPCVIKGDVNGDGLEDVYVGGENGMGASLFIQQKNAGFILKKEAAFDADKKSSDVAAVFIDVNNDGKPDLYVCSGGYDDYLPDDPLLQDRVYLNDGKGNFTRAKKCVTTDA